MNQERESVPLSGHQELALQRLINQMLSSFEEGSDPEQQLVHLAEGEILFKQGDQGKTVYVLKTGVLGVRLEQAQEGKAWNIARLTSGAIVGEMAVLSGRRRSATVFAVHDAELICMTQARFQQLLDQDELARVALKESVIPRWRRQQLVKVLSVFLGEVETTSIEALEQELEWLSYSNGDVVFRQGDESDGMYIVVSGRLRTILPNEDGTTKTVGEVGPGEPVGEMAILTNEPRSATVHAIRYTSLVKITGDGFRNLTRLYPELLGKVARIIAQRQQRVLQGTNRQSPFSLTLAVLPASESVDILSFADELGRALASFGSTLVLDGFRFDQKYGSLGAAYSSPDDAQYAALVAWMNELDTSQKYLLYVADADPNCWTRRCLGQADRVLIVADPKGEPTPTAQEKLLEQFDVPVRTELVLWHPVDTSQPSGTSRWLDQRNVQNHHHVRYADKKHMARLARRLTGNAIALVYSGGGARGFAHLGVHRAIEELDMDIDYVGATSMGAVLSGGLALGLSSTELMRQSMRFASPKTLFDYTLPFTSLMTSRKITRLCKQIFDNHLIEDLWFPFFCISCNLTTAEIVIHQRGPIWRAVRTSLAIPGVFTPVMENGEVLVDGAVMDNFPATVMADLCESKNIIGVHLSPNKEIKPNYDFDTSISGWRILFSRLNPFAKRLRTPSLISTILRAQEINSVHDDKLDELCVDLMIEPDVLKYQPLDMDFTLYKLIAQSGYEAALEPLRKWQLARPNLNS